MDLLSDADVAASLDYDAAIGSQRLAFASLGRGEVQQAAKTAIRTGEDTVLSYLSRLSPRHGPVAKLVSVNPGNADRGLPSINATVLVLDAETGALTATMSGTTLTEIRTAAGSAVALDALAPAEADVLAVIGSGVQARAHVRAISRVRALTEVRIHSRDAARRESTAAELAGELGLDVRAVAASAEAVRDAAMVVACTLSPDPVVATADLARGATVVSVGSFEPHRREVDGDLLRAADRIVVDDVDTATHHAGPIMAALDTGDLDRDALTPLGAILTAQSPGRKSAEDLIFYNSVGIGVQDAAAALAVLGLL
ncbi:ornithine cyclodeaminase family protein [Saccharopolyspora karakumensis]|uniref:Ornithine cyclodeaminase family protein n=1 Tax=Saccharopolyspora karakumensis TaxID=2530386 RepID=A0A4R5BEK1_9PSEU|nr:ornithine cyclodeaminase family protein [Saccharopolyspora karakumensis]TDD83260.1 ornithine cyclodeaminase family protein [Saccharopolyspora karakumensis]